MYFGQRWRAWKPLLLTNVHCSFGIKGVLISNKQPDVEHVHESYQQKCLSLSNQTNPEEPISLKRKYLTESCKVNKELIGQRELYEKKKRLNESPEPR